MRGRLNFPLLLLSLGISFVLWTIVYNQTLPVPETIPINLVATNLDSTHWSISSIRKRMNLGVVAPADALERIKADSMLEAVVDLSDAKEGTHKYQVTLNQPWVKDFMQDQAITESVTLEPVVSKQVHVKVDYKGSLGDPGLALTPKPSQPQIMVTGPKGDVEKTVEARAYLDLAGIDPTNVQPQTVPVQPLDNPGIEVLNVKCDPREITITPIITAASVERTILISPVFVGQPAPGFLPNGYRLQRKEVTLTGKGRIIDSISKILTDRIDIDGATKDKPFKTRLRVPFGTEVKGGSTISGTYLVVPDPSYKAKSPSAPANSPTTTGGAG